MIDHHQSQLLIVTHIVFAEKVSTAEEYPYFFFKEDHVSKCPLQAQTEAEKARSNYNWDTAENARTEQRMKKMKEKMKQ